jgi:hypothetical protein
MFSLRALLLAGFLQLSAAVCDGNPHQWNRMRRCDQYDPACPSASWALNCGPCEGIGGLSKNDQDSTFVPTSCKVLATPEDMKKANMLPKLPLWPKAFVNTGFYEQQIFVRRDPFCLAQIPSMVSNGTHCFKDQEGTFNYDSTQNSLRIDYFKSRTTLPHVNMTEHFYHLSDGTVHPEITKYGKLPSPVCPCISLGIGPVSWNWAADAEYVGREHLGIEYMWVTRDVDHWVKGPHHVWTDVETGNVVRLYQPFNGLEVFDPYKYSTTNALPSSDFELPKQCVLEEKLGCINGTQH